MDELKKLFGSCYWSSDEEVFLLALLDRLEKLESAYNKHKHGTETDTGITTRTTRPIK